MNSIFFIVLRRMRAPLIVIIAIFAVSVLGLTLVPGVDANGLRAAPLSFFHAFYFISYTATTIGFGEIPNAFSDAQRLWVTVCIYLTVIGWSYSIVTLLALLQDKAFQSVLVVGRFARRVRQMQEPFYLICGCGETGALVCHALDELNIRFVVLEQSEERVQELDLEDFKTDAPALAADVRQPKVLRMAGLTHPKCRGVLALTNDDTTNLAVAIATRLLSPKLPVLARADDTMIEANMASFGTQHIINPYERFADYFGLSIEAPHSLRLVEWLTGLPGQELTPMRRPPSGHWVVCGHGRFSRPVVQQLADHDLQVTVITPEPVDTAGLPWRHVTGLGVRAGTLCEAGIEQAVGLVAGTDNDINNLSIAMTAKDINPDIFIVLRQNRTANTALFKAFSAPATMIPSRIIALESLATIINPLLTLFLKEIRAHSDAWAAEVCIRLESQFGQLVPQLWGASINAEEMPAVSAQVEGGGVALSVLLQNFEAREEPLGILPLLLFRNGVTETFPPEETILQRGDAFLFAGTPESRGKQRMAMYNPTALTYLISGLERPGGYIWQWLAERRAG